MSGLRFDGTDVVFLGDGVDLDGFENAAIVVGVEHVAFLVVEASDRDDHCVGWIVRHGHFLFFGLLDSIQLVNIEEVYEG